MKALKLAAWTLLATFAGLASETPAQAAWNNVFQPTCFGCRQRTSNYYTPPVAVRYYAPAAPACNSCAPVVAQYQPQPCQQCQTNYVQKSYYQPVTTYESRSYYEPVTTYQTSYYYEAVTSYQTSYYQDPCSCCLKAQTCPVTSYQLKQQCCPVQSWVQRCAQVPVTSYKQVSYYEPVTTCAPVAPACPPPCANPAPSQPAPSYSPPPPPVIDNPKPAPMGPNVGSMSFYPPTTVSNWQPSVSLGAPQDAGDAVRGQVTRNDRSPKANAELLFVNAATGQRHTVTTNDVGRYNTTLATGSYHIYLANNNGTAAYYTQVNVDRDRPNEFNIVN